MYMLEVRVHRHSAQGAAPPIPRIASRADASLRKVISQRWVDDYRPDDAESFNMILTNSSVTFLAFASTLRTF